MTFKERIWALLPIWLWNALNDYWEKRDSKQWKRNKPKRVFTEEEERMAESVSGCFR